ncbi:competence protein ComEC [Marinobacter persicus]|uniref:Competence protein ComEC n=1 Tax=Marinobacter persicus TaxID=930118 RepID=A0A1I3TRG8_9GAMM|nr:DNA internalization-related competence protein ComEC/Rec2 [Marinobacter persicus]GHD46123.1 DNA internalization-related competence protein ComEC/Rec2 [Marinobacter persicus]SFJ72221.1 competence protein ComEC [Marinobacter persicus]
MSRFNGAAPVPRVRILSNANLLAFCSGAILLYRLTPWPAFSVMLLAVILVSVALWYRLRSSPAACLPALLCCLALGLAWTYWQADNRLQQRLPEAAQGRELAVSGYLCSLPRPGSFDSLRFNFCVESWHTAFNSDWQAPETLRLAWYGRDGGVLPGQRLRLNVVLKRPHGYLNSAGFRYEDWLFRHAIRATGSIRSVAHAPDVRCGWHCRYHAWYRQIAGQVERLFGNARYYPLVASLLIGNRNGLTDAHWQTLQATGTIHLVAISGLHLGLVAMLAAVVLRKTLLLLPVGHIQERRVRQLVFAGLVSICVSYALLAGFGVPTRRALIMVIIGGWYLLLAREFSPWRPFVLALTLVLLTDPFAPLDQGFWLSFGAVAILLLAFAGRLGPPGWFKGLVIAQLAIFAGLWPILAQFEQQQPLAGIVANLVAIPWLSVVVMPVLLIGGVVAGLAGSAVLVWLLPLFDGVLAVLWRWLVFVETLPWPPIAEPHWAVIALLAVCVLVLLRFPFPGFRLTGGLVLFAWAISVVVPASAPGNPVVSEPELVVWDVGQGLSVMIRARNRVLVYDTGPGVPGVYSAADSVLIPGLAERGVHRLDRLVISHGDNDHAGGLPELFGRFRVGRVTAGEIQEWPDDSYAGFTGGVDACRPGIETWAGLELGFWQSAGEQSGNAASCVVQVFHRPSQTLIWLTGDITHAVEREMLEAGVHRWFPAKAGRRWVIAPHHGSKTSSSPEWVRAVAPDRVIYTAGFRHRYGHPHADVTARYRQAGARALSTACSGQIVLALSGEGPRVSEQRSVAPFWIAADGLARDQCQIP